MSISTLFHNLENHITLKGYSSFSEDYNLEGLASLDFATAKIPKAGTKLTQKGGRVITCDPSKSYPCGKACKGLNKDCKNPIEGQAKTYAEWLDINNKAKEISSVVSKAPEPVTVIEPEPIPALVIEPEPEPEIQIRLDDFESVKLLGEMLADKYLRQLQQKPDSYYLEEGDRASKELEKVNMELDEVNEKLFSANMSGIYEGEDYEKLLKQQETLIDKNDDLNIKINAANEKLPYDDYKKIIESQRRLDSAKRNLANLAENRFMYKHLIGTAREKKQEELIKDVLEAEKNYYTNKEKLDRKPAFEKMYQDLVTAGGKSETDADTWLESLGKRTPKVKKSDKALKDVYRLTGGNVQTLKSVGYETPRAFASKDRGFINVGKSEEDNIIFHEVGHHLEYSYPEIQKSANEFLQKRSTGQVQTLRKITKSKSFRTDEIAIIDKFIDPYVGKIYKGGATEVVSMGLERFCTPAAMKKFKDRDPEHFHYILGVLAHVNNLTP